MVFSALVVATSGAGYVLGSGNMVDIAGLCCTCAGTMMVAASANTLNQVCACFSKALSISMLY
jgi:protoheme IX farnesyltransferase